MKKFVAIFVTALMICSLLGACGQASTENKASTSSTSASQVSEASKAPEPPVKYTMYLDQSDIDENATRIKVWLEKTGGIAELKITGVPENDFDQKITVLAAADELPDIISRLDKIPTYTNLINNGMLLKLDELIEKNMPNYTKAVKDGGYDVKRYNMVLAGTEDTYHLPVLNMFEKNIICMNIRVDLFEQAGVAIPKTADEYYDALKTLKQKYPEKVGLMNRASWATQRLFKIMFGVFDIKPGETPETSQSYKEMLKFAAMMYKEGLIDKEFITTNEDKFKQVMDQGNILTENGCGAFIVDRARGLLGITVEDDQKSGASAESLKAYQDKVTKLLKPIQIPVAAGKRPVYDPRDNVSKNGFVFNKNIKNPEIALKLVDYLYSDEGAALASIGVEGIQYSKNGDAVTLLDTTNAAAEYQPANFRGIDALAVNRKYNFIPQRIPMVDLVYQCGKGLYASFQEIYKGTDEQKARISELSGIMEGKTDEYFQKFVMGILDVDKDWDAYIKELNAAGLTELEQLKKSLVIGDNNIIEHMEGANSVTQP